MAQDCILIVEADSAVRNPLAQYLRECGYKVFEALDTDEALTILGSEGPEVDVVFADVESPGSLGGFGLSRWIRSQGLATKIILAGTVEHAAKKAGDICEQGPVLVKPYHHHSLLEQIKRSLAQRQRATEPR